MKRILSSLSLILALALSLCGCGLLNWEDLVGGNSGNNSKTESATEAETSEERVLCYLDGALFASVPVGADGTVSLPAVPQKEGYTTDGVWYADADCSKPYDGGECAWAKSEVIRYRLTVDYDGGVGTCPTSYTIEDLDLLLPAPTRDGYVFDGWEENGTRANSILIPSGSTGDRSVRALWRKATVGVTYRTSLDGVAPTAHQTETTLSLSVPGAVGDMRFAHWKNGETVWSKMPVLLIPLGDAELDLVAVYESADPIVFDLAAETDLVLTAVNGTVTALLGGNIALSDCTVSGNRLTVPHERLTDCGIGTVRLAIETDKGTEIATLSIVSSRPTDARMDCDSSVYPDAELRFSCTCGSGHLFRLDGGTVQTASDGTRLTNFDKTQDHVLILTCGNGTETTVRFTGCGAGLSDYSTRTFSWDGKTWDYVIGSERELAALMEYTALVSGVIAQRTAPLETATTEFLLAGTLTDRETLQDCFNRVTKAISFPMLPQFSLQSNGQVATLSVTYPNGLNGGVSTQTASTMVCAWYKHAEGRGANAALPIDACLQTVSVRTVYELERLPFGTRPVFSSSGTDAATAQAIWETARTILCENLNDDMNDYEKVTAIYVWLGEHLTYDRVTADSSNADRRAFTLAGALLDRVAVCDGYASAFRLLCQMEGIDCEEVIGLQDPSNPSSGHAWNKVTIGGVTWGVDATWARQSNGTVTMRYLFMGEETLRATGHYENGTFGADSKSALLANGIGSYYEWIRTGDGTDLFVSDTDEMRALVRYMQAEGLDRIEFQLSDSSLLSEMLRVASQTSGKSVSSSSSSDAQACTVVLTLGK